MLKLKPFYREELALIQKANSHCQVTAEESNETVSMRHNASSYSKLFI